MPRTILGVELYTLTETAELMGVTIQTIRNYVRKGMLTPTLIGKTKYVSADGLREYLTKTKHSENRDAQTEK